MLAFLLRNYVFNPTLRGNKAREHSLRVHEPVLMSEMFSGHKFVLSSSLPVSRSS